MPKVVLRGIPLSKADELMKRIAKAIYADDPVLCDKTTIIHTRDLSVPATALATGKGNSPSQPHLCIYSVTENGDTEEFEALTEILSQFGFDIEWHEIKEWIPVN